MPDNIPMVRRSQAPPVATAYHEWLAPDGESTLLFYRREDGYLLRFPELADFELSDTGQITQVWAAPGVAQEVLDSICANQVWPLALSRQGRLVLHAGVVEVGQQAVLLIGRSGAGKSTLVSACARAGYRFLADDCALLENNAGIMQVAPGRPLIRLRNDSWRRLCDGAPKGNRQARLVQQAHGMKVHAPAGDYMPHCALHRKVVGIFLLEDSGYRSAASIRECSAGAGVTTLLEHSFLLDVEDPALLSRQYAHLTALVRQAGVHALTYPRRYDCLPAVIELLIGHLHDQSRASGA